MLEFVSFSIAKSVLYVSTKTPSFRKLDQIFWIEYLSLFYFLEPLSLQFVVTVGVKDENLLIGAIPDASETDANE